MNNRIIMALAGVLFIVSACSDNHNVNAPSHTIYGSGDLVSESRPLPHFNSIVVNTVAYVGITRGDGQEVVVTADDNIVEYISTRVSDGALYISVYGGVSLSDYTLEFDITVTDLEAVIVNSVATIEGNGSFDCDYLVFEMNSVGNINVDINAVEVYSINNSVGTIELSGAASRHNAAVSSVGSNRAYDLETDTTFVVVSSVGNAYVKANAYLHATINSIGSIYYRGYPEIHLEDNGTGRLINDN
ncbi:MAG: DUF2807 domain-containing protein [Candidatus Zixiibacteriota bacterium]|nr:MAG: DUF2807 domain-containing protein [candidate division Zixibacteria bacterium]